MGFQLHEYNDLVKEFEQGVNNFQGGHKAVKVDELPQPRKHQVLLLQASIKLLNESNSPLEKKAHTLTGIMLLTKIIIENSYLMNTPENSTFYRLLTMVIGLSEENILLPEDIYSLINDALHFIEETTCRDGSTREALKEVHPFTGIPELSLKEYWIQGSKALCKANLDRWEGAEDRLEKEKKKREEEQKPQKPFFLHKWFQKSDNESDDENFQNENSLSNAPQ